MPAAPGMRDHAIADEIAAAQKTVAGLVRTLGNLVAHAEENDATAHAEFYETVQGCLASAEKQLGRADDIMRNSDPD